MGSIYDWSLFAADNANADNMVNWAEGQPPSTVNNSARVMMQRVREFISDFAGIVTVDGTANAIAVQTNSKMMRYQDGITFCFCAKNSNTGPSSLNLNTLGAKPIFKAYCGGVGELQGGEIQRNAFYKVVYSQALNNATGGFFLTTPTQQQAQPTGMISQFAMPVAPNGWLMCDGAEVSRQAFAPLFTAIGTRWGAGNKLTTFNLPDLRGVFLRGWDNGRNLDQKRSFATMQQDQNKSHSHVALSDRAGAHQHSFSYRTLYPFGPSGHEAWSGRVVEETKTTDWAGEHNHNIVVEASGGSETRPVNIAVFYAIKA